MTPSPLRNKRDMYDALAAGRLGNTIPQYFSVADWLPDSTEYPYWGVRTLTPGGPCSLHCHQDDVPRTAAGFIAAGHGINISAMVDMVATVTLWAEVVETTEGLYVGAVEYPTPGASWRAIMPTAQRPCRRTAAIQVLARHLNPNSLADLRALLSAYTEHVVELSALDRCFGTVPHRNAVIWEVRSY